MAAAKQQALPTVTVKAEARWVRSSARKARIVLENVRGRTVPEARTILRFTQRHVATDIEKVLHSAVSNAEANHGLIGDELVIAAAYRERGADAEAFPPARARPREPDPQAHLSHHDPARRGPEGGAAAEAPPGRARRDRGSGARQGREKQAAKKPKRAAKTRAKKKEAVA